MRGASVWALVAVLRELCDEYKGRAPRLPCLPDRRAGTFTLNVCPEPFTRAGVEAKGFKGNVEHPGDRCV